MSINRVLIIGNGFDLDLGLKSSFSDFMESDDWPSGQIDLNLRSADMLYSVRFGKRQSNWFDLEDHLFHFANPHPAQRSSVIYRLAHNKKQFEILRQALMEYLTRQESSFEPNNDSVAAYFMKYLMHAFFSSVYTFNYTGIDALYMHTFGHEAEYPFPFTNRGKNVHIHGSLKDKSAILGIADGMDVLDGYSFLYKTFSPFYHSCNLWYDLQEASEVVFFGHSLGPQDYHYFQDFFRSCCVAYTKNKYEKKRIIFVTKDESCRVQLLEQIRQMNEKKTDLFLLLNDVRFVYTSQPEKAKQTLLKLHAQWYKTITGNNWVG